MKTRCVALCCALALIATACGSRLSDDQLSAGAGTGGSGSASAASADGGSTPAKSSGNMIGDLPIPCGKGDQPPGAPPKGTPGVTEDTIKIAVISDRAGQVKVPTASIEESMQAYVDWCNGYGGINGRKLELTKIDSKLFSHLEATKEACNAGVFALVGSGSVTDNQGAQAMVDCGLVEVPAYTATAAKGLSDNLVAPIPNPANTYPIGQAMWMADKYPDAVKKAAAIAPDIETGTVQIARLTKAYKSVGFKFVYDKKTAPIQDSYASEANEMKKKGVQYVTMVHAVSETNKLLRDMKTQGVDPEVVDLGQQYYDPELLTEPASEGAYVQSNTVPFEEAKYSPALQVYLEQYDKSNGKGGVRPTSLGVQAFSAGLLFSTAAKELGDDLTRQGLLDQLHKITKWDGGGLHFVTNPGDNLGSDCFMYMQVQKGKFVRVWPTKPATWDCDPSYSYDLNDDYGGGAKKKAG
ncbi:MAG: ABC transporter substrate-binding protein [Acidimicrobiales bacterium]